MTVLRVFGKGFVTFACEIAWTALFLDLKWHQVRQGPGLVFLAPLRPTNQWVWQPGHWRTY
jgi:hypothetical protein